MELYIYNLFRPCKTHFWAESVEVKRLAYSHQRFQRAAVCLRLQPKPPPCSHRAMCVEFHFVCLIQWDILQYFHKSGLSPNNASWFLKFLVFSCIYSSIYNTLTDSRQLARFASKCSLCTVYFVHIFGTISKSLLYSMTACQSFHWCLDLWWFIREAGF